jgi:putative transposase
MRKQRQLLDNATYHVTSKIDHGAMALQGTEVKQLFLDFVKQAKKKFRFELWNFMVMDNHIHFLIKPGKDASLSEIMQWIKCNFAKKWNKLHDTHGHVWGERFFSKIIWNKPQFEEASAYIDNNPVKANLVAVAQDWEFGGLFHKLRRIVRLIDVPLASTLFFPASVSIP